MKTTCNKTRRLDKAALIRIIFPPKDRHFDFHKEGFFSTLSTIRFLKVIKAPLLHRHTA